MPAATICITCSKNSPWKPHSGFQGEFPSIMQKLEFFLRRIATSILVLIGVSVITFFIARVVPANPAALYIGPKARQEDINRVTKQLGLDKPLPVQYLVYMQELLHGDLGTSISTKRPITEELTGRIPATLELLFSGMFIAILLGVPLGVLSSRAQGEPLDVAVRILSIAGVSMPAFFLGLILQIIFFRNLHLLPLSGRVDSNLRFTNPLVEIIFNWPGLGLFTVRSLLNVDYPAIMGMTLFGSMGYVLINLIVDLLQAWVDPRISLK